MNKINWTYKATGGHIAIYASENGAIPEYQYSLSARRNQAYAAGVVERNNREQADTKQD
jgi:hypothetical protein